MTRRERLERKAERRREWAAKAAQRSAASFDAARRGIEHIPPGQPILVGHHSEKHHRRDLERHDNRMRRGVEQADKAEHHESKAAGLEAQLASSIYSDDPDAIEALEAKAAQLDAHRDLMKRANAAYRKANGTPGWAASLGLEDGGARMEAKAAELFRACPYEKQPFPGYSLTNASAEARRARARIEEIKARRARTDQAEAAGGVLVKRNGLYASVTFAERPDREILDALKAEGFHYSGGTWFGHAANLPPAIEKGGEA